MTNMTKWQDKADEDLTAGDLTEMRRLAVPVGVASPGLPPGAVLVTASQTYSQTVDPKRASFELSQPQLLNA